MLCVRHLALLVRDYDEAIAFYVDVLGFELVENTDLGNGKRWVRVAPRGGAGAALLLARAVNDDQRSRIGNQTGGRIFLFIETDHFESEHRALESRGVKFIEQPRHEPYGTVAVFEDLYGNKIDLIEPAR
jgi:catechol 2,3-dioxygenase-like lactoylglutathione lyase family enzyme